MFHTIKQLEEKNVANEIVHMIWSDRMDLVAYSTIKGEVALHRLTWTRAWSIAPNIENLTVKGIAWRPDGKVLAIGYSNGEVSIVSIENKVVCKNIETHGDITCIHWVQEKAESKSKSNDKTHFLNEEEQTGYMEYIDFSSIYLPEPPMLYCVENIHAAEENEKPNILHEQSELNILLIGTKEGIIHINIFGAFPCVQLNINEYLGYQNSIEDIMLTEDLSKLIVTVKDLDNNIKIVLIDSSIFHTNTTELFAVALKYVRILYLVEIISSSIRNITETWESILLEMDNKLSKFASKCPQGGVTADFLDLLIFGIYSSSMEEFLLHDLTIKGLEKFGQSIEMNYSTIQELLLKYVTKYGQCITYHLAELRGMVRLRHKYDVIGLVEDDVSEAILSTGAFLIKAGEMHQIINNSIINYKAFFRWLYTAIMQLLDEQIPSEIPRMTQQDLAYITEFFQNFDHIGEGGSKQKGFIMERLGQYLSDSPLTLPPKMNENEWSAFLAENKCLRNDSVILNHNNNLSLVQQLSKLKNDINNMFLPPEESISKHLQKLEVFHCFNSPNELKMTSINLSKESILFSFHKSAHELTLLEVNLENKNYNARVKNFHFSREKESDPYVINDMKFYSKSILSLLLQDQTNHLSILYQFPIASILDNFIEVDILSRTLSENFVTSINCSIVAPKTYKDIDMIATQLAVSGSRKVGIVLSENKRKVKLFEMEGEEEDDEDAEMTMNATSSPKMSDINDTSMQDT